MPNPFMRTVQQNTSDEAMTPDRPHPTAPVLETYDGSNHPYRGIESHGIEDTGRPTNPQMEWADGTRKVVYDEDKPAPDPVPVRIVTEGGEELRKFRASSVYAGVYPRRIIGRNRDRTSVKIYNSGGTQADPTWWIGVGDNMVSNFTAYPIPPRSSLDLDTQDEVWACWAQDFTAAVPDPNLLNVRLLVIEQFAVKTD